MLTLLTGGSACGKSSYAESICIKYPGPRFYIAAMQPYGEEGQRKIAKHRAQRDGKGFETIERYTDLASLELPGGGTVLLECICNLTANEMFDELGNMRDPYGAVTDGVRSLAEKCENLVVITNDVGSDFSADYDEGTRAYIAVMGRINRALSKMADNVYELVCGIPIVLKGELL
ncbi:MAG: bifunctional adenosylcobinamide kinase/adenosylcobinamide-phosphate guanylyltransferase [Oscillospiraceae bacterium]|nr:bifunctional adenosylcobinamide kinase/adenosylcobinamide-phosphate guanylyltransferase [Oscillospiraceae bacterium]